MGNNVNEEGCRIFQWRTFHVSFTYLYFIDKTIKLSETISNATFA